MKQMLKGIYGFVALVALATAAWAQGNPRGTAQLTLKGAKISVEYGRPALNGRKVGDLLGELKAGDVWRLGADKSTTFSTSSDLKFGEVAIPKGEYSLWVRKEAENSWKLVFNKQHGQWGTNHDPAQDLPGVPLKQEKEKPAEQVTVTLEEEHGGGEISILWGDLELSADFNAK